jgi:hypothetical protein
MIVSESINAEVIDEGAPASEVGIGPTSVVASHSESIDKKAEESSGTLEILKRITASARLFRSIDGRAFAQVPVESRSEVYELRSAAFRDWLIGGYFRERQILPSEGFIRRLLGALEAFARFEGGTPPVFVRIGSDGESSNSRNYIDLGDQSGQAVEYSDAGWSIVEKPGVCFWRPDGLLPLPSPSREGSIELLRPYVNLTEEDFRLLVVWMAAAIRPCGPYPILVLYGEQGSAKSTLSRIIRLLIDPQSAPLRSEPRDTRDLICTAVSGWLLAYDNISTISPWLSDGLCVLATGGGTSARSSITNHQAAIYTQRPIILNGIEEFVKRGDLSDRSVFLELPSIDPRQRRREDEFWRSFREHQPQILGGLLDAVVGGLRELPSVKLPALPRMADFAAFAEAIGCALGWKAGTVLADYNANRLSATSAQIEESLVATALLQGGPEVVNWYGTATELLEELSNMVGKKVASSARWPKSPARLTNELRRLAPQLYNIGVTLEFKKNYQRRLISIVRIGRNPQKYRQA